MSLDNLKIDSDAEQDGDFIPAPDGHLLSSGIYPMEIEMAYVDLSKGGAMGLFLTLKDEDFQTPVKQTIWMTSGDAKGNRNYYIDAEGKKKILPGMAQAEHIAKITTGKSFSDLDTEDKIVKVWDSKAGTEKPTKVRAVTDLIGQKLVVGLLKKVENRNVRTSDGQYRPVNKKRYFNEIGKLFYPDGLTVSEKEAGGSEPGFINQWKEKYENVTIDNYKEVDDSAYASETSSSTTGGTSGGGKLFS